MAHEIYLDHLAVGVRAWSDGYPTLVSDLGGSWLMGGDAGEFAPCQLMFGDGMRLELICPGSKPDGFMSRFLHRHGPGPHHLTFRVPSLDEALRAVGDHGIQPLAVNVRGFWHEAFLHPKDAGMGTLLQLVEADDSQLRQFQPPAPDCFPNEVPLPVDFAWIGLTTESVDLGEALFVGVLQATVTAEGAGWRLYSWGPQRRLLVRGMTAKPGGERLWPNTTGVAHLVIGPPDLSPLDGVAMAAMQMRDPDPRLGLTIWSMGR